MYNSRPPDPNPNPYPNPYPNPFSLVTVDQRVLKVFATGAFTLIRVALTLYLSD